MPVEEGEKKVADMATDFLKKAMADPAAMDDALRIAATKDITERIADQLETLPAAEADLAPTLGRSELTFIDEMFTPPPKSPDDQSLGVVVGLRQDGFKPASSSPIKSTGGSTGYYEIPEGARELNDLIEYKGMSFALGNIFKACYRLGQKADTDLIYDINKIIFFAERMKAYAEKNGRLP